jgi:radical SAM protein with 4Fe4S-binding SPASM domain
VTPEQFGHFLITIFDEWVRHDVGRVFVQTFEATVRNWLGLPSSGMCVFDTICGQGLALEHNGDLYSCDHFVEPKHLLGNRGQDHMIDLAGSDQQLAFGRDKLATLPRYCRECEVGFACKGECPKNRFLTAPDGEPGLNYLCAGYRAFFQHVDHPLKIMAGLLRRGFRPPRSCGFSPMRRGDRPRRLPKPAAMIPAPAAAGASSRNVMAGKQRSRPGEPPCNQRSPHHAGKPLIRIPHIS